SLARARLLRGGRLSDASPSTFELDGAPDRGRGRAERDAPVVRDVLRRAPGGVAKEEHADSAPVGQHPHIDRTVNRGSVLAVARRERCEDRLLEERERRRRQHGTTIT